MYIKYFASIIVALLVCGLQRTAEARRHSPTCSHGRNIMTSGSSPVDSILSYMDTNDLLKLWNELSAASIPSSNSVTSEPGPSFQVPTLAFDVKETNTTYEISCDLPGVHKSDISLGLKDNELTISAVRDIVSQEGGVIYRRQERQNGEVSRTVILPDDCEKDKITAESKDGVLVVTIPKVPKVQEVDNTIQIEIK